MLIFKFLGGGFIYIFLHVHREAWGKDSQFDVSI